MSQIITIAVFALVAWFSTKLILKFSITAAFIFSGLVSLYLIAVLIGDIMGAGWDTNYLISIMLPVVGATWVCILSDRLGNNNHGN